MKQKALRKGFTLVELLVVIAIIAILAGILLPTVIGAFRKASEAQVRTELKSIETAVKAYVVEYSKVPANDNNQGSADTTYAGDSAKPIIQRLTGNNPRKILFLEANSADGTFLDPWDQQYELILDTDYDNEIRVGTNVLRTQVVVYSLGDTGTNRIYSFQK